MKPKSIIRPIRDRGQGHYERRIASLTGQQYIIKPTHYENTETGEEYYAIAGSIAFPVGKASGFALVVAALKEPEHEQAPRLKALDELEVRDLVGLLAACEQLRHKWGYPHQLDTWIGDEDGIGIKWFGVPEFISLHGTTQRLEV